MPVTVSLDEIDLAILGVLERDGRIPNVDLAEAVGLTPSPCLRRVRRLEEAGVIRGYGAWLEPSLVGRGFLVFATVTLERHDRAAVESFEAALATAEGVTEAFHISGAQDYLLRVEVADLEAYDRFIRQTASDLPWLGALTTYVVLTRLDVGHG